MKKIFLLIPLLLIASVMVYAQVHVTFNLNLNNYPDFDPAVHSVYLSGANEAGTAGIGSLPVWPMPGSEPGFKMSESAEPGYYTLTIANVLPDVYAYKYFLVQNNEPSWNLGEWSGNPNRVIVVENQDASFQDLWGVFGDFSLVDIVINEIQASNLETIPDEDGDFEDWIELHNRGNSAVNLAGFALSDDQADSMKWIFPGVILAPDEYLVVFASDKNRLEPSNTLHTNFKISSAGEPVLLTNPEGEIIDQVPPVMHAADLSFGRMPNSSGNFLYLSTPTPGALNLGESFETLLSPLEFSHPDGFYASPFDLSITAAEPGVTIRYTTDGSEPDNTSPVYSGPMTISGRAGEPNTISMIPTNNNPEPGPPYFEGWQPPLGEVFKINVVRARAFHPAAPDGEVYTFTAMVDNNATQKYSLPVFSLITHPDNLFDDETGIYVPGNNENYFQDGWERPAHIALFNPAGELEFKQNIGIRLNGNTTRSRPRKSLRIVSRAEYGESWINYQLFPDKDVEQFKRFILRNSGNDWDFSVFRDGLFQYLVKDLKVETQYYQPAVLFINGEYWGIHNIRDKYDDHYIFAHYGINENELTIMSDNSVHRWGVWEGTTHYNNLRSFIENNSMANASHYEHVVSQMDTESFIDFQLTHIFAKNTDWPGNNSLYWRYHRDEYAPEEGYRDGRWRWIILDTDFGFDLPFFYVPGLDEGPAHNTLAFATEPNGPSWPNPPWSTLMLRKLLANDMFKTQFINRYCDLLNTTFSSEHVMSTIDSLSGNIAPEMAEHINRWRRPTSLSEWQENIQGLRDFASQRSAYQMQHLKSEFGLSDPVTLTVDVSNPSHGFVKVNSIDIKSSTMGISDNPYPWSGDYFPNINHLLTAVPMPGYEFSHWTGAATGSSETTNISLNGNTEVKAHFVESPEQIIHFWLFDNSLANDTPLESVDATFSLISDARLNYHSALAGYPFDDAHPSWRKASMERRNSPTSINYHPQANNNIPFEDANMRALQIRQPFTGDGGENTIYITIPTQGFQNVKFQFAAKNEGAADALLIDYSSTEPATWTATGLTHTTLTLGDDYQLYSIDLSAIDAANDNPDLQLRIRFAGTEMAVDDGNRVTFNNFSLSGYSLFVGTEDQEALSTSRLILYPNPASHTVYVGAGEAFHELQVFDMTGRKVINQQGGDSIDVSDLQSGVYTIRAITESGKVITGKFIRDLER
jgi:hypothetical protein